MIQVCQQHHRPFHQVDRNLPSLKQVSSPCFASAARHFNRDPLGKRVIRWRDDKGGEFMGAEFKDYWLGTGITQEFAANHTPQQIVVSERVD